MSQPHHPRRAWRSHRHLSLGLITALVLLAPALQPLQPLRALELRGMTVFQTPPWKLTFRNYYTTVMDNGAE